MDDQGDFRPILPTFGPDEGDDAGCPELEACKVSINDVTLSGLPTGYVLGKPEIARSEHGGWDITIPLVPVPEGATIYLVRGTTGSYSDQRAWDVRAFVDEADARALCDRLNAWCRERELGPDGNPIRARKHERPDDDPGFEYDSSSGTEYGVFPVPFGLDGA